MNPQEAEMDTIRSKDILAREKELPVKLFLQAVKFCYTDQLHSFC